MDFEEEVGVAVVGGGGGGTAAADDVIAEFEMIFADTPGEFSMMQQQRQRCHQRSASPPPPPITPQSTTSSTSPPSSPATPSVSSRRKRKSTPTDGAAPKPRWRRDPNAPRKISKRELGETLSISIFVCRLIENCISADLYSQFLSAVTTEAKSGDVAAFIAKVDTILAGHADLIRAVEGMLPPHHPRHRSLGVGSCISIYKNKS